MSEFVPLSERSSTELKALDRMILATIEEEMPMAPNPTRAECIILGELTTIDFLIKCELAQRWFGGQDASGTKTQISPTTPLH